VKHRFGEEVAQDVVRCAKELDKYDASRRVGVELPWHPVEDRELDPAEVINLMDRELALAANLSYRYHDDLEDALDEPVASPYAVANVPTPPRRERASRNKRRERSQRSRQSVGSAAAVYAPARARRVPLPRLDQGRRGGPASRAGSRVSARGDLPCLPDLVRPSQEPLQHPLLGCIW